MKTPTNKERAERARRALEVYRGADVEDECHIQDLVSDLLHLAVKNKTGWEFVGQAISIFADEVKNKKWQVWANRAGGVLKLLEERIAAYSYCDWQLEVRNGDTKLGYKEWVEHRKEADRCSDRG